MIQGQEQLQKKILYVLLLLAICWLEYYRKDSLESYHQRKWEHFSLLQEQLHWLIASSLCLLSLQVVCHQGLHVLLHHETNHPFNPFNCVHFWVIGGGRDVALSDLTLGCVEQHLYYLPFYPKIELHLVEVSDSALDCFVTQQKNFEGAPLMFYAWSSVVRFKVCFS